MKMKKYIAISMPEAMKKVKSELGEDAVIVSSKVIYSKGFLGMLKKKQFEVVAGVNQQSRVDTRPDLEMHAINKEVELQQKKQFEEQFLISKQNDDIQKQLDELKQLMRAANKPKASTMPKIIQPIYTLLKEQELNDQLITDICDELFAIIQDKPTVTADELLMASQEALFRKLSKLPMGGLNFGRKFVNVLGPTGVGKTTTIAKIAARAVLEKKKKVAFITTDTYRIGAIEQLKTYANLLHAPVEVVYTPSDYKRAIEQFAGHDLILIDTAGRNYKEARFITDLEKLIDIKSNAQNYLVLSLTAKENDMATIIEQFEGFDIDQLIFTKLDETNTIGSMVNLMVKYNKGLAYYTDGQEVPENIEEGSVSKLVELIYQGAEK
ncbi:MAG: flagellar biosynthesis protein FlhF [Kurthia sp.]|nr:flagellar biosynthesis protein FlhF [Candidatus Kurthia equi]